MRATCTGTTRSGAPCGAQPRKGGERCWRHPADTSDTASRARNERWSREGFLVAFEATLMVSTACQLVGIHRSTVYAERDRNDAFAKAWAEVEENVIERLEAEAYRRAVDGVTRPLVSAGKHVTDVTEYSDSLLMFLLKARKPHMYRERVDVKHSGGQSVKVELVDVRRDRAAEVGDLLARCQVRLPEAA